jgi:hypothetical protein
MIYVIGWIIALSMLGIATRRIAWRRAGPIVKRLWLAASVIWSGCVLLAEYPNGWHHVTMSLFVIAALPWGAGLLLWWIVCGAVSPNRVR